jgi:hypothetical protein
MPLADPVVKRWTPFRSSDTPLPRVNCERPNSAQRGLGRENAVAQDWRSRSKVGAQIAGCQGVACLPIPARLSRTALDPFTPDLPSFTSEVCLTRAPEIDAGKIGPGVT